MALPERLVFYKSSYSSDRVNCVEVAHFRKSSYSGHDQNCVEVAHFRKSSYSGQEPNCIEVADLPSGAALRDSKYPGLGHLAFPAGEWDAFLSAAKAGTL